MKNLVLCLGLIGLGLNAVSSVEALSLADQALFSAAKAGDLNAVNSAITAGADVNAQDNGGYKPLDYCLARMHNSSVSYVEQVELYQAYEARNKYAEANSMKKIADYHKDVAKRYHDCADVLRNNGASTKVTVTYMRPFDANTNLAGLVELPFRPITEAERSRINE